MGNKEKVVVPQKMFDQPNLNQPHQEPGAWEQFRIVYTGYGQHAGEPLVVTLETSYRRWALESLEYVRARQREHRGPVDARLERRMVIAAPWDEIGL